MRRERRRRRAGVRAATFALALLVSAVGSTGAARADDAGAPVRAPLLADASCEALPGPGRLRCDVTVAATGGASLRWADVQILSVPPGITVLRGRVGPEDALARSPAAFHFRFSLVAKTPTSGDAELRVRAVVCNDARCQPVELTIAAGLRAGPAPR